MRCCIVRSKGGPISGWVSERLVDTGISASADQTALTRIVSTSPIHFAFQQSEALLLKYQRAKAGLIEGTPVRIHLQDESSYVHAGRLKRGVRQAGGGGDEPLRRRRSCRRIAPSSDPDDQLAFIFGVIPLAIATGPGSEMRRSLGTSVGFGMLGVTLFGLVFTPIFYVVTRGLKNLRLKRPAGRPEARLALSGETS